MMCCPVQYKNNGIDLYYVFLKFYSGDTSKIAVQFMEYVLWCCVVLLNVIEVDLEIAGD